MEADQDRFILEVLTAEADKLAGVEGAELSAGRELVTKVWSEEELKVFTEFLESIL